MIGWLVRLARERQVDFLRGQDDELAEALELAIAWHYAFAIRPKSHALTLAVTEGHATASLFAPVAGGHAQMVHHERSERPADALAKLETWMRDQSQ